MSEFKSQRMEQAYYWAAQLAGWAKHGPNAGIDGRYYVEIIGGKPILVMDDTWTASTVKAVQDSLRHHGFPMPFTVRELDEETRLFITPTSDRLTSDYDPDWREFTVDDDFEDTATEQTPP